MLALKVLLESVVTIILLPYMLLNVAFGHVIFEDVKIWASRLLVIIDELVRVLVTVAFDALRLEIDDCKSTEFEA